MLALEPARANSLGTTQEQRHRDHVGGHPDRLPAAPPQRSTAALEADSSLPIPLGEAAKSPYDPAGRSDAPAVNWPLMLSSSKCLVVDGVATCLLAALLQQVCLPAKGIGPGHWASDDELDAPFPVLPVLLCSAFRVVGDAYIGDVVEGERSSVAVVDRGHIAHEDVSEHLVGLACRGNAGLLMV